MKITVLGDIMCEPCVLRAAKEKDGYSFDKIFDEVKPMLDASDYVIGNLEFPLAGEEAGYSNSYYDFSAPDSYADAVKSAGIDLVSTVNNHTLDRGVDGMLRTLDVLDRAGVAHTGSFRSAEAHEEAFYFTLGETRFALVAYTYTTNKKIPEDSEYVAAVNFLRHMKSPTYLPEVAAKMKTWVDRKFPKLNPETRGRIKKLVGLPATLARADDYIDRETAQPFVERFKADIAAAKQKADVVIAYPHVGGQFNSEPGAFSCWIIDEAVAAGADMVLASHSHLIQRAEWRGDVPVTYSLGNFNMSASSTVVLKDVLPDFGIALHLYYDGNSLEKITFSLLKAVEKKGSQMVVWPVDQLYASLKCKKKKARLIREVKQAYRYFMSADLTDDPIRAEYSFISKG